MPSVVLLIRFLIALVATSGVMLKGLARISPASGIGPHESDGTPARADHGADEVAARRHRLARRYADHVVERGQRLRTGDEHAELVFHFRPERLGDRRDIDVPKLKGCNHRSEAAGLHKLGI